MNVMSEKSRFRRFSVCRVSTSTTYPLRETHSRCHQWRSFKPFHPSHSIEASLQSLLLVKNNNSVDNKAVQLLSLQQPKSQVQVTRAQIDQTHLRSARQHLFLNPSSDSLFCALYNTKRNSSHTGSPDLQSFQMHWVLNFMTEPSKGNWIRDSGGLPKLIYIILSGSKKGVSLLDVQCSHQGHLNCFCSYLTSSL